MEEEDFSPMFDEEPFEIDFGEFLNYTNLWNVTFPNSNFTFADF